MANIPQITAKQKYWCVFFDKEGKPLHHKGQLNLGAGQLQNYANALGCKLMKHLPPELK